METLDWTMLPTAIWISILLKLTTVDIIENVQNVCRLFRNICKQSSMFATVDMSLPFGYNIRKLPYDIHIMTRYAISRNAAGLTDIYIEYLCSKTTIRYIGNRCKNLKRLRFAHLQSFSDGQYNALIETMKRLEKLEEVHLRNCFFSASQIKGVGHACPSLRSFLLIRYDHSFISFDDEAKAISRSMPNLRRLMVYGNDMSKRGLTAILDSCRLLEYLDLRGCSNIKFSVKLRKRCQGITHVRYPDGPFDDIVAEHQLWKQHMRDGQQPSDIPSTSRNKRKYEDTGNEGRDSSDLDEYDSFLTGGIQESESVYYYDPSD